MRLKFTPSTTAALMFVAAFGWSACDSGGDGMGPPPPGVTVAFTSPAPSISAGDTVSVQATSSDGSAVSYSTSAPSVATVDAAGKVTGVSAGTASIMATAGGATANLEVTVAALTPAASIVSVMQNGQPVDTTNVSGALEIEVSYEVGNAFDGEIVVWVDSVEVGSAPLNGGGGGGSAASRPRQGIQTVPVNVAAVRVAELSGGIADVRALLPNGPGTFRSGLRGQGGLRGITSGPLIVINNRAQGYVHLSGSQSTNGFNGLPVIAPDAIQGFYIGRGDTRTLASLDIEIESIEIIRGPAATIYGANAVNGVVRFNLDASKPWTQGGDAVGGLAALRSITGVTASFTDNTTESLDLINALPNLPATVQGLEAYWDLAGAEHLTFGTHFEPTTDYFVGAGVDFGNFAVDNGFGWLAPNPQVVDIGWESSLSCDFLAGLALTNLLPVQTSEELTEGQPYHAALDCEGELNSSRINVGKRFFGDFTGPSLSLSLGAAYLEDLDVNEFSKVFGFTGSDPGGAGFDPSSIDLAIARATASGTTFEVGADDGQGGALLETLTLPTPGRYDDIDFGTGYYNLSWGGRDGAGNSTFGGTLRYTFDPEPPSASVTSTPTSGSAGDVVQFGWDIQDDFELRYSLGYIEFDASTAVGASPEIVGQSFDNQWTVQVTGSWETNLITSFEWADQGYAPNGNTLAPQRFFAGGVDFGRNAGYASEDITGRFTPGGTDVWRPQGYDWLTLHVSPFSIPATGGLVAVEAEARTAGTPRAVQARLYARNPGATGGLGHVLIPVSDHASVTAQNNGGWYQEFANLEFDTDAYAVMGFGGGNHELVVFYFDADSNVLASRPVPFTLTGGTW